MLCGLGMRRFRDFTVSEFGNSGPCVMSGSHLSIGFLTFQEAATV